jgi:hypothetical protein
MSDKTLGLAVLLLAAATHIAVAGQPVVKPEPEPFEPFVLEPESIEINLFSQGTLTNDGWDGSFPGLGLEYQTLSDLTLHAIIGREFSAPARGKTRAAFGDTELGVNYRLITPGDDDWFPEVAAYPLIEVPTGDQKLDVSTGHVQVFLPISLQKDIGPWTVYCDLGYWINPGRGNKNYPFFTIDLWRKVTDRFSVGVDVTHTNPSSNTSKGNSGVDIEVSYELSEHWRVLATAGNGVQNRAISNEFSYYIAVKYTY